MAGLTGWHLVIILVVILLLFGASRLPGLAKSLGESMRIFRKEVKTMGEEDRGDTQSDTKSSTRHSDAGSSDGDSKPDSGPSQR